VSKKNKGGRPVSVWTPEKIEDTRKKLEEYVEETQMPIIAEFAYQNNIIREELYDHTVFSTLLKRAIAKKETFLEKAGLANKVNNAMAIFSLKQLGWRDMIKQEIEVEVQGALNKKLQELFFDEE